MSASGSLAEGRLFSDRRDFLPFRCRPNCGRFDYMLNALSRQDGGQSGVGNNEQLVVVIAVIAEFIAFGAVIFCAIYLRSLERTLRSLDARLASQDVTNSR